MLLCLTISVIAQKIEEKGVVLEYKGRKAKEPLPQVKIKAIGSNWATSDSKGTFILTFDGMHSGDIVENPKISRSGYVLFNKDAVSQWRLSGSSTFNIVMCNEDDFTYLLQQYYGIYEKSYKKEYDNAISALEKEREKSKMERNEYENKLRTIESEYRNKLKDINNYVEIFAYIDENEANGVILQALDFFKQNKLEKALDLYQSQKIKEQVEKQLELHNKGEAIVVAGNEVIHVADSNTTILIPMLRQEIELLKLTGKRNERLLVEDLKTLIKAYKSLSEEIYRKELSDALCDLGNILYDNYDSKEAFAYYKESADLGNSFAQYRMGILYESLQNVIDMDLSRKYYSLSANQGNLDAIERLNNFWDFYVRNRNGIKVYYKILSEKNKKCVKVTYFSRTEHAYETYPKEITEIPAVVQYNGQKYAVTELGDYSFSLSRLTQLVIPSSIVKIGNGVFESCFYLKSINIPENVSFLGKNLFNGCSKLTHIFFSKKNKSYDYVNGIIISKDKKVVISSNRDIKDVVEIPYGVTSILPGAFDGCDKVKKFVLPNTIQEIGEEAFADCDMLREMAIPEGVKIIGHWVFRSNANLLKISLPSTLEDIASDPFPFCSNLRQVHVADNSNKFVKDGPLLMNKTKTKLFFCERVLNGTLTLPHTLSELQNNSVYNSFFYTILLPESMDSIAEDALFFNRSLSMTIPPSVKLIGRNGLYCNKDLIELFLCDKLVGLDESSISRGYSFCPDVYCFSKKPIPAARNAFGSYEKAPPFHYLHVPIGSEELYRNDEAWSYFTTIKGDLLMEEDCISNENDMSSELLYKKALMKKSQAKYEDSKMLLEMALSKTKDTSLLSNIYWQLGLLGLYMPSINVENNILESVKRATIADSSCDSIEARHSINKLLCASYLLIRHDLVKNDTISKKMLIRAYEYIHKNKNPALTNTFMQILTVMSEFCSDYLIYTEFENNKYNSLYNSISFLLSLYYDLVENADILEIDYSTLESHIEYINRHIVKILPYLYTKGTESQDYETKKGYFSICYQLAMLFDEEKFNHLKELNKDPFSESIRNINPVDHYLFEKYGILSLINIKILNNAPVEDLRKYVNWFDLHNEDSEIETTKKILYKTINKEIFDLESHIKTEILPLISISQNESWHYDDSFKKAVSLMRNNSIEESYTFLKREIGNHSFSALETLARYCKEGIGMPANEELSLQLFDYACQKGDSISLEYLQRYYFEKEDYQNAYKYLISSQTIIAYWCLGQMYQHGYYVNWNLDMAVEYYKKLRALGYDDPQLFESVAKTFNELAYDEMNSNSPIQQSLNYIDKAIELCPTNPNYYDSKGEIYLKYDNIDEAIKMWKKVIEIDPDVLEHWEEEGIKSVLYRKLKESGKI